MTRSALWRLLPLLGVITLGTGCIYVGDWGDSDAYKQDFHSTHPLDAGGRVSIESFNGSIEVTGWEQNAVEVNGTKHASFREALDDIKVDIDSTPGSIRIRAVRRGDMFRNAGVRFSIRVPRKAVLDQVSSSNGRIEVDGVDGKTRLRTSNGAIRIMRVTGDLEAATSNGSIDARFVSGNVNFHTSNGSVNAAVTGGSFEAVTSNGSIEASLEAGTAPGPWRMHSSNGHITLRLNAKDLPELHASTSNSPILLRLPGSANARVRAYTSHSSVSSEFEELHTDSWDHERRRTHSQLEGTIGHGGPLLDLETSNGSIRIQKL